MTIRTSVTVVLFWLCWIVPIAQAERVSPCLRIGIDQASMDAGLGRQLSQMFISSPVCLDLIAQPVLRSQAALQAGYLDGEAARSRFYATQQRPPLIVIEPRLLQMDIYLLSTRPFIDIYDQPGTVIGYVRDDIWAQAVFHKSPTMVPQAAETVYQLIHKVHKNRVQGFLVGSQLFQNTIQLYNFNRTVFDQVPLYLLVHPRHADKVDDIERVMKLWPQS